MNESPPTEPSTATLRPPLTRTWSILLALLFVGGPTLGLIGLCAVWVRSLRVAEVVALGRDAGSADPASGRAGLAGWQVRAETMRGVLGITLVRNEWSAEQVPPSLAADIQALDGERGWHLGRMDTAKLGKVGEGFVFGGHGTDVLTFPGMTLMPLSLRLGGRWGLFNQSDNDPYRPFDRDRATIGATRTLHWKHWATQYPTTPGGVEATRFDQLVMPCWAWMLPMVVPLTWWAWCPRGRAFPRLTLRRTIAATAGVAVGLAMLAALGRSTATDRALATLEAHDGRYRYGPDPDGSGEPVVDWVCIGSATLGGGPTGIVDADIPRVRAALDELPHVRELVISTDLATAAGMTELVRGLPAVEDLSVRLTNTDDATLAEIAKLPRLRILSLVSTKVTDAGLAHLARHPTLQQVELNNLPLTEAGLAHLAGLPRLESIVLSFPTSGFDSRKLPFSDDFLRQFARSLPSFDHLITSDRRTLHRDGSFEPPP